MNKYNSCLHVVIWLKGLLPHIGDEFGRIPPIKKLAELKGCSIATMHKAIKELEIQGLCVSEQGHGTYVRNISKDLPNSEEKQSIIFDLALQAKPEDDRPHYILLTPMMASSYVRTKEVSSYIIDFYTGAMKKSEELNLNLEIKFLEPSSEKWRKQLKSLIKNMKEKKTQGIITASIVSSFTFNSLHNTGIPFLIVDHWAVGLNLPTLNPNHFMATEELILVLANMKHTNIGLLDRKENNLNPEIFSGYEAGLKKAGLKLNADFVLPITEKNMTSHATIQKIQNLCQREDRPTAFITYTSNVAINLIKILEQMDLKVPKDISVVTFCAKKVMVNGIAISGIVFDWEVIGNYAVEKVFEISNHPSGIAKDEYLGFKFLSGNTISFNSLI